MKTKKPDITELIDYIEENGVKSAASYYNVSDRTIYKWTSEYKFQTDLNLSKNLLIFKLYKYILNTQLNSNDFLKIAKVITLINDENNNSGDLSNIIQKIEHL